MISYCVDEINSTSLALLYSECEINITEFVYHTPSLCDDTLFTVTPVNDVGNGTNRTIAYSEAAAQRVPALVAVDSLLIVMVSNTL